MNKKLTLYIAYGSNMNLPQMVLRYPMAEMVVTSELRDFELLFHGSRSSAVAAVELKEGSSVPVLLWKIREKGEASLDRYERYPRFYDKQHVEVELNGKVVSAMVYIITPGHKFDIPSDWYTDVVRQGYETAGLGVQALINTVDHAWELSAEQRQSRLQSMFDMGRWGQQK